MWPPDTPIWMVLSSKEFYLHTPRFVWPHSNLIRRLCSKWYMFLLEHEAPSSSIPLCCYLSAFRLPLMHSGTTSWRIMRDVTGVMVYPVFCNRLEKTSLHLFVFWSHLKENNRYISCSMDIICEEKIIHQPYKHA